MAWTCLRCREAGSRVRRAITVRAAGHPAALAGRKRVYAITRNQKRNQKEKSNREIKKAT